MKFILNENIFLKNVNFDVKLSKYDREIQCDSLVDFVVFLVPFTLSCKYTFSLLSLIDIACLAEIARIANVQLK